MAIAEGNTKRVRGLRNRGRSTGGGKIGWGSSNGHGGLKNGIGSISDE